MDGCLGQRASSHPGMTVEQARDSGEEHVLPVGIGRVEDVRQAEDYRGDRQPAHSILEGAREQILQEPSKQKFLRPRGKKQNPEGDQRQERTRAKVARKRGNAF